MNKLTEIQQRVLKLTPSGKYYVKYWGQKIMYYDLELNRVWLAKAKCKSCNQVIESKRCGHFVKCTCGASFIDTDRWFPERHRYGGEAIAIR